MPRPRRKSIWSFISAISGETTIVTPSSAERGQLVRQRLAAARRKHRERGMTRQQRIDDLLLTGPEFVEAEMRLEQTGDRSFASISTYLPD